MTTQPDDLVERLTRTIPMVTHRGAVVNGHVNPDGPEAAATIKELKAEVERSEKHRNDLADKNVDLRIEIGALKRHAEWAKARTSSALEALRVARGQFAFYVEHHLAKSDEAKAAQNQRHVDMIDAVLANPT